MCYYYFFNKFSFYLFKCMYITFRSENTLFHCRIYCIFKNLYFRFSQKFLFYNSDIRDYFQVLFQISIYLSPDFMHEHFIDLFAYVFEFWTSGGYFILLNFLLFPVYYYVVFFLQNVVGKRFECKCPYSFQVFSNIIYI